jgi:TRAP-type uncharacterized transport system substrate-binding protein
MAQTSLTWRRGRGWLALGLALAALAIAVAAALRGVGDIRHVVTLTAGVPGTTRALVASALARDAATLGVDVRVEPVGGTGRELERVNDGHIDLAAIPGAFPIERLPHVREVTPLYVEALHLLVKEELADAVTENLAALRGRTVSLGPRDSTTSGLANAVLEFAQVASEDDSRAGFEPLNVELSQLTALVKAGDRSALPDAVFHLATVPSTVAEMLVRSAGFRLVPLPFAEAFRLESVLADGSETGPGGVEHQQISDTVIPAFTYQMEPPVPAEPLHTLGTRLILVANDRVPVETVERIIDTVYGTRFARITYPPLDPSALAAPPRVPRHEGTLAYMRRDKPVITDDAVDTLSNSLSILGALLGGSVFLWQWWRQRRQARRDEVFGSYMLQVADIERRTAELELAATLELPPLAALQRELLELNTRALERFAAGELGDQATLSDLLMPINAAREHIGQLVLHLRDTLEDEAQARGRSLQAVWAEATRNPTPSDRERG